MKNLPKSNIKKELITITIIFLLSRLLLLIFIISKHSISFTAVYDALNYIEIAKNGYTQELLYAFFPLFPLLIRLLHFIIPSYEVTSLILSNVFSFLSVIVLYKLIEDNKNKLLIIIAFIFSPILVFNTIGYTESLYLLLSLAAFYFYRKGKISLCGILTGLLIITRNTGIVLATAIGIDILYSIYKKERKSKELILFILLPLLIGLSYHLYLYINTGDFFNYITVQFTNWDRSRCNLISLIINDIKFITKHKNLTTIYLFLQNWIFYFIGIFYSIKYIKKEKVLSIYLIISLLLFVTTSRNSTWDTLPSISLFRYVFGLFPIYIFSFINKNKKINIVQATIYTLLALFNSILLYDIGLFIA